MTLKFRGLPGSSDPYVRVNTFDFRTSILFETADKWSVINKKFVTVNAIDNGTHGEGGTVFTFHGLSLAWDLGVDGSQKNDFESLGNYLKMRLPPPYEVIVEVDHVHIEWDTHQGR